MGNNLSTRKKENASLSTIMNKIAAKYILTSNFQDLQNLKDPQYCNKIAVLTTDIINKHLTAKEIVYLKQKTQNGEVIDEMTKSDVVYLDKNKLNELDVQTTLQKKRVCYGIAKYYIKVAHLFSSIVGAINPEFSYIDENKIERIVPFKDKASIPENMKTRVKKINLCNKRINALINNKNLDTADENEEIVIQPKFCNMNLKNDASTQSLINEPGMPELETLYYDVYDYDSGEYKTMSEDSKQTYLNDVKTFYKHFTGIQNVPENVTRFSHILLKDYHTSKGCKPGEIFTQKYTGSKSD